MKEQKSRTELHDKRQHYVDRIREKNVRVGKEPWYKALGKKIEYANKKLTYHFLGRYLNRRYITSKIPLDSIRSILFLRPDAIGDMIVTTPLWHIIKKRNPNISIGVAGSFRNVHAISADKTIDTIFSFDLNDSESLDEEIRKVQKYQYDVVVLCKLDQKARGALLARRCSKNAITVALAWDKKTPHHKLFTATAHLPPQFHTRHHAERLLFMMEEIFDLGEVSNTERQYVLSIEPSIFQQTSKRIVSLYEKHNATWCIVINTQAQKEFLEWGYENSFAFAREMTKRFSDVLVFLTSSPFRERELLDAMNEYADDDRMQYFPTPDLHEMFSLVRLARLVVSPDTSVVPMASAEAKPCVAFYMRPSEWIPYGFPAIVIMPEPDEPVQTIKLEKVIRSAVTLLDPNSDPRINNRVHIVRHGE